ncbi:MAG: hypothetical protein WCP85_29300 [Mariniphaga sp.]
MKIIFKTLKLFAVAIVMPGFVNLAMAQNSYTVENGGRLNLTGSSTLYNSSTINSGVTDNSSTATIGTVPDGSNKTVTIGNGTTLTGYYGNIEVADDMTLELKNSTASKTIPAKFLINGSSATTTLKLSSTANGLSFTGTDGSGNTISMNNYGILDLSGSTKDITLSGSLYMNGYTTNAPQIKWAPSGALSETLPKIIISGGGGVFQSSDDGNSNALRAGTHFSIDLTNATGSSLSQTDYTLVQLSNAGTAPAFSGSSMPTVTGNTDNAWTVDGLLVAHPSGSQYNVNVRLTFDPLFALDATAGGYATNFNAMHNSATDGIGNVQTLRKNKTSGLGNYTLTKDICVDLQSYTLGGASQKITINDGKRFALKAGSGGVFDSQINFGGFGSRLVWLGNGVTDAILGPNFDGSSSSSYGSLQIGDGSSVASATLGLSGTKVTTINKIGTVIVSTNATLTITQ